LGKSFGSGTSKDGNGHGTHVSGTIAGKTFGVAKKAQVVCVKVLDDSGSGSYSDVIGGVNWVAEDGKGKKAVANMSLGGGPSSALDEAVDAAIKSGVIFVVAAGNEEDDACYVSPARTPSAITVAATTKSNNQASFSNYGKCVDLYAPGVAITSAWSDGNNKTISGTSMASPHVAGVAALFLSEDKTVSVSVEDIQKRILENAIKDVVRDASPETPNILARVPVSQ
jgi:subtilisin family serine protease